LEIPPKAFQPQPKVQSATVTLIPQKPPDLDLKTLGAFTAKAFRARRKTLANNLKAAYGPEKTARVMSSFQIEPAIRAEKLPPEILAQMAKLLETGS
jgi:16S rRNA (adenine1518-N6/adenine1519-N6)-dimethyltransferase